MQLSGQKIYLTGATGGIGSILTRLLIDAGADVTAHNRITDGDLIDDIDQIAQNLQKDTPDMLIHMAGINICDYCENQDMSKIIDLNLLAPITLTQAVLPAMKKRNQGHIIYIGSMVGLIPLPHMTGYAATKAGLKAFSDALRRELSHTNIHISCIIPRAVRTAMNDGVVDQINQQTHTKYDTADKVAEQIIQAILKNKAEVRLGWPERFFAFLHALCPRIIDHGLARNRAIGDAILSAAAKTTKKST